eukprot:TRINITY_DN3131_c4_g1_i1.p1 TRINITY_DN3131_c4_g1~~TRINITY_DN3131_c4_g1_i1.p1  ORF type:complete len:175 (+),score=11.91 TRINITY_DN3131_c4_g1_i1:57-527(+)
MALIRINKELVDYDTSSTPFHIHRVGTYSLRAILFGEENTPYSGGVFWVSVVFPTEYPFKPPRVKFETKIFHPNISTYGSLDMDILGCLWSPALTIVKVLKSIVTLLREPNNECILNTDAHNERTKEKNQTTAMDWTKKYACPTTRSTNGRIPRGK